MKTIIDVHTSAAPTEGETAVCVAISPKTTQGWRPISVKIQPAAFAPNGAGPFSMAGNVWEWTADAFRIRSLSRQAKLRNQQGAKAGDKVVKGGSFLCADSYCMRYRPAARHAQQIESAASHIGFRCVTRHTATTGEQP